MMFKTRMRPVGDPATAASNSATIAATVMMASAIQPMVIEMFTLENDPFDSDPAMFEYTFENTGKMTATVNAKMTLMITRSAAG